MSKAIKFALSLFAALWLSAGMLATASADTLDDIRERGEIVIGVKADYPPFGFINAQGENAGFGVDIARYVALRLLGSESAVELVPVVASNRIQYLRGGRIDLIIATMSNTEERDRVIDFSRNYYASGTTVLAAKDAGIQGWDDLKNKQLCGIQGSFYNTALVQKGMNLSNFPGTAEAYQALKANRCIGFAYDNSALVGKLQEAGFENYAIVTKPILVTPWGMGLRPGDDQLRKAINDIILEMEANGYIYALEQKWGIPHTDFVVQHMKKARQKLGLGEIGSSVQ